METRINQNEENLTKSSFTSTLLCYTETILQFFPFDSFLFSCSFHKTRSKQSKLNLNCCSETTNSTFISNEWWKIFNENDSNITSDERCSRQPSTTNSHWDDVREHSEWVRKFWKTNCTLVKLRLNEEWISILPLKKQQKWSHCTKQSLSKTTTTGTGTWISSRIFIINVK